MPQAQFSAKHPRRHLLPLILMLPLLALILMLPLLALILMLVLSLIVNIGVKLRLRLRLSLSLSFSLTRPDANSVREISGNCGGTSRGSICHVDHGRARDGSCFWITGGGSGDA